MSNANDGIDEAQHLLRQLLVFGDVEIAADHQWLSEADRWKELVFALLTRATSLPQTAVRVVTDAMRHLDLLQIDALASLAKSKAAQPDAAHPHSRRIIQVLTGGGFSQPEALKGLTTLCEAAAAVNAHFSGKVQLYLRHYADRMLKEAPQVFDFSQLDQTAVRYALTLWLQNVSNAPLSLHDDVVRAFCEANGVTSEQLFDAADDMDINVALVDDLVYYFHAAEAMAEVRPRKSAHLGRGSRRRTLKVRPPVK